MSTIEALKILRDRYDLWANQAAEAGNEYLFERYSRLREAVSGLLGDRVSQQHKVEDAARQRGRPASPRRARRRDP